LVEGGKDVSGAFFAAGLVDELSAYIAPNVIGGEVGAFQIGGKLPIRRSGTDRSAVSARRVGPDLMISYLYHQAAEEPSVHWNHL